MGFSLPKYHKPDFTKDKFVNAPDVKIAICEMDGVAPEYYHATSMYPEYFKVDGVWKLAEDSRMDGAVRINSEGILEVVEMRNIYKGDLIILGRSENCEEGIYLHTTGFDPVDDENEDQFVFRKGRSRETAFSKDYDNLYNLIKYEKEYGNLVWVMGPACTFDCDSKRAMQSLIDNGYVDGLLASNALATHDLEGSYLRTALGQDIYSQISQPNGHYNHLDTLNEVRKCGSIPSFIKTHDIKDGIMYGLVKNEIPYVLAGSIRDDGPMPEVIHSAYDSQDLMRNIVRKATTVICMATALHTIATGNMTPSYRVVNGEVRPLFIYCIDISEFATNKLSDRGSLTAISIVTNVQDFIVNVAKGLGIFKER